SRPASRRSPATAAPRLHPAPAGKGTATTTRRGRRRSPPPRRQRSRPGCCASLRHPHQSRRVGAVHPVPMRQQLEVAIAVEGIVSLERRTHELGVSRQECVYLLLVLLRLQRAGGVT